MSFEKLIQVPCNIYLCDTIILIIIFCFQRSFWTPEWEQRNRSENVLSSLQRLLIDLIIHSLGVWAYKGWVACKEQNSNHICYISHVLCKRFSPYLEMVRLNPRHFVCNASALLLLIMIIKPNSSTARLSKSNFIFLFIIFVYLLKLLLYN